MPIHPFEEILNDTTLDCGPSLPVYDTVVPRGNVICDWLQKDIGISRIKEWVDQLAIFPKTENKKGLIETDRQDTCDLLLPATPT